MGLKCPKDSEAIAANTNATLPDDTPSYPALSLPDLFGQASCRSPPAVQGGTKTTPNSAHY